MAEQTQQSLQPRGERSKMLVNANNQGRHQPRDTQALLYETNKSLVKIPRPFHQSTVPRVLFKSLSYPTFNTNPLNPIPGLNIESFFPVSRNCLARLQQTHRT